MLRVKKLYGHIQERLDVSIDPACWYVGLEIPKFDPKMTKMVMHCNDKLLKPNMTLATVKNLFWKSGTDIQIIFTIR
jgi:hypothetical protein